MTDFLNPQPTAASLEVCPSVTSTSTYDEGLVQPGATIRHQRGARTPGKYRCPRKNTNMYRWVMRLRRTTGGSVFLLLFSIYFLGFSLLELPGIALTLWHVGQGYMSSRDVLPDPACSDQTSPCHRDLLSLIKGVVQVDQSQQKQQKQLQQQQVLSQMPNISEKPDFNKSDLNKSAKSVQNDTVVEKESSTRTKTEEFFYIVSNPNGTTRRIPSKHPVVRIHQDVNLVAIMEAFHHPWKRDDVSLSLTRSELERCCSTRKMALMTQENKKVGVPSAFNPNDTYKMTEQIFNSLPKKSPFPEKLFKTCSVVGNSGILRESNCARVIDSADYIFRCNMPPLTDKRHLAHVGTRSNFTTVPMSMLRKYGKIETSKELRDRWYNQTLQYKGMVIIKKPKDSTAVMQAELERRRTDLAVGYENPAHFIAVQKYWEQRGLPRKITSGFYVITMALTVCEQVNVYGFWPFPFGETGGKVRYHYYYAPIFVSPETHDMAVEFMKVRELHQKGVIRMQLGKCEEKPPKKKKKN